MAGRKLTVLPALGEFPAADDLLYIVDVTDTSESPQGTSKAVEFSDIMQAGTYTPVISGEVNWILVNPNGDARFMRIGSNVIVFAQLEITMDTGENTGSFEISLPVASELTSQKDCFGMMQLNQSGITTSELDVVVISAEITNNTCLVELETITTGATLTYCTLQFTYQVQ
jgi:hypothetical protein